MLLKDEPHEFRLGQASIGCARFETVLQPLIKYKVQRPVSHGVRVIRSRHAVKKNAPSRKARGVFVQAMSRLAPVWP